MAKYSSRKNDNSNQTKIKAIIERMKLIEYLKSSLVKIFGGLIIFLLFLLVNFFSRQIVPDQSLENPVNILGNKFDNISFIFLNISSILLFGFIILAFYRLIFTDNKEDLGIENNLRSKKTQIFSLLIFSYIICVYILLDVAIKNIYLFMLPIELYWLISNNLLHHNLGTDRLMYATIRNYYFLFFFLVLLFFTIVMFFGAFTSYGRKLVNKTVNSLKSKRIERKDAVKNARPPIRILIIIMVTVFIQAFIYSVWPMFVYFALTVFFLLGIFIIPYLTIKFLKGVNFIAYIFAKFSFLNLALILPILLAFYILPAVLWTSWDFIQILSNGNVLQTVHTELQTPLSNNSYNIATMDILSILELLVITFMYNLTHFFRIIEIDFVIVIGVSALIIGFAEGFSIFSILFSLLKGINVARSGQILKKSSPRIIQISTSFVMLFAWISFFTDRIMYIYTMLLEEFSVNLPAIEIPKLFNFIYKLDIVFDLGLIVIPLALLIIPLYYILMSSFKFLSVTILKGKTEQESKQTFFLLISSAFVLVATNILEDITIATILSDPNELTYLPTAYVTFSNIVAFGTKIVGVLESASFYAGVILALYFFSKALKTKIYDKYLKEETIDDKFRAMLGHDFDAEEV